MCYEAYGWQGWRWEQLTWQVARCAAGTRAIIKSNVQGVSECASSVWEWE
jgi:hypothetical protein